MVKFTHLHVHTHYSVLDGMSKIPDLVKKSIKSNMFSIAITDHGNMFGVKDFLDTVNKINKENENKYKENTEYIKKINSGEKISELEAKLAKLNESIDKQKQNEEGNDKVAETEKKIKDIEQEIDDVKSGRKLESCEQELANTPTQKFKPIIGIEAYCARRTLFDKDKTVKEYSERSQKEVIVDSSGWHLILLAKNKTGYKNLCKIVSQSWIDGFYNRPRIDKNILEKHHEGIIVCSACIGGEIPQLILSGKINEAKKSIEWFKNIFGEDYYLELQRHKTDKINGDTHVYELQQEVNPIILKLAKETNTKVIATNDVHFVEEAYCEAHDRLICLSTGKMVSDIDRLHYTKQEWLKTPEEMYNIFSDIPEALENTQEISDKVEFFSIDSGPIMPKFDIPEEFGSEELYRQKFTEQDLFDEFTQDEKGNVILSKEDADAKIKKLGGFDKLYRIKLEADYLAKLTWDGAKKRYGESLTEEQKDQIIFELHVMKTMGFPGYFLIVQDYIRAAREELGVSVGPGRGSAAGSVVAYCLKITNIDPLKYNLLFERFLNPDRISLPDIDVDFEDRGRAKVLDYVTQKYGKEKVAHIITYGTMGTKSSIADVSRVQGIDLGTVSQIKKFIPDNFSDKGIIVNGKTPKVTVANCLKYVSELRDLANSNEDENISTMLEYAAELDGTIRQIGIHACGVIIGADDLTNFAPLCIIKDKNNDVLVTEYDGHVVESVGLIKMDFLGLSTLSIIREALLNIKKARGIDIDIDNIPIDDEETYKLYSNGQTTGTFQFESPGMQKYLRDLKPRVFEDLIAMNALYRPGPMSYIPAFIRRKLGQESIEYDIPVMEKYLKETYGITVYQEQVMLLSRLLANFTRGESDTLRKAMGKKQIDVMQKLQDKFLAGGQKNGYDSKILMKIWKDWESFASYALNKSHATCYAWIAYQTSYLKAHYPAEFMAANLTQNKDSIDDVTKFMIECKRMGINVLAPDINESYIHFMTNSKGNIRFGLGGIKGVGENVVDAIVSERENNGPYNDIFDFISRVNLNVLNKKALESLAAGGAFDCFNKENSKYAISRGQLLFNNGIGDYFIDTLLKFGKLVQAKKSENTLSLFGDVSSFEIKYPDIPPKPDNEIELLNKEAEVIGMYLSGHPLDNYKLFIKSKNLTPLNEINNLLAEKKEKTITFVGYVTKFAEKISKRGKPYGVFTLLDYHGTREFLIGGKDYINQKNKLSKGYSLLLKASIRKDDYTNYKKENDKQEKEDEYKLYYDSIMMLNEIDIRSINIYIDYKSVYNTFTSEFMKFMKEHKGKTEMFISFMSLDQPHIKAKVYSRILFIDLSKEVVEYLESQPCITSIKIN